LVHITERIQINNELIPRDTLNTLLKEIYQETKDICQFSYFELLTLAAVRYFIEEQVDYVVCETGL
jgi:folylpolyglutamate synthase/dihydropteroate synthase